MKSPTPWRIEPRHDSKSVSTIIDANGFIVAAIPDNDNALTIINSVNKDTKQCQSTHHQDASLSTK